MTLQADPIEAAVAEEGAAVLEGLDLAEDALANLARLSGRDEDDFRDGDGWAARVVVGGVALLVVGNEACWRIAAPAGTDESDAALAARRLHGLLGEMAEGWDLDR